MASLLKDKVFLYTAAFSFLLAVSELFFVKTQLVYLTLLFFVTLTLPSLLLFFYREYEIEKRQGEIDASLPAALFQIASFPRKTPVEKIFESIAKSDFGPLSVEFAKALKQIQAGYSVKDALEAMQKRNSSALLNRTCSMLSKFYRSGADSSVAFKETAEDVYSLQEIVRETSASFSLQKYTLLIGGAFLVPVILALLYSASASLQQSFAEDVLEMHSDPALQQAVLFGNQAYLAIFALVASVFIARSEEKPRKAVLYFAVMLPLSLLLFNLVRGAIII